MKEVLSGCEPHAGRMPEAGGRPPWEEAEERSTEAVSGGKGGQNSFPGNNSAETTSGYQGETAETHEGRMEGAGVKQTLRKLEKEKWKEAWTTGAKGQHLRELAPEPSPEGRKRHAGRKKAESAILIQLRTGKIGFRSFLYERGVPGV